MSTAERKTIRIGTRASKLAMWQAEHVLAIMQEANPDLNFEICSMTTTGDNNLTIPLSQFENKGVFTKELDVALLTNKVDVVVHCMKDLATKLPKGIRFCAIMERESPDDCVILHPKYKEQYQQFLLENEENLAGRKICPALSFLQPGAIIGTSALRRQATLARYHPTLVCKDIRGNVGTRLQKLDNGEFDAIILAKVGIDRLGLSSRISATLDSDVYLHAVGQAALAIVCRTEDEEMKDLFMASLHNIQSSISTTIERGMLYALQGGCKVPIACSTSYYVVPNGVANKQLTMIDTYRAVTKTLMLNELQARNQKAANATSPDDLKDEPIETDPIPDHLYKGITSIIDARNTDLRTTILEQNNLVHQGDSDYEDDDLDDDFTGSVSFNTSYSNLRTHLTSLSEDGPAQSQSQSQPQSQPQPLTPVKNSSSNVPPLSINHIPTPTRRISQPLTPRTQSQTWSLLVITRAAVISMDGQNYVETIKAEHFPLYLKSQFYNPVSSKAWAVGIDLGNELHQLGASAILEEIRANAAAEEIPV